MLRGGAAPQNWKQRAATSKCSTSRVTLRPSPEAATSTLETLPATLRCAPEAVISAPANGDIIVFLPRNLAANIDAVVVSGGEGHIEADPELHMTMQASNGSGTVHAVAVLHGGGVPLKLKTTAGKIRLKFLDSDVALHQMLVSEQVGRLNNRLKEYGFVPDPFLPSGTGPTPPPPSEAATPPDKTDWLESWLTSLEIKFRGGMTEDADDFQKRLVNFPKPSYPALAQRAGLQGLVKLLAPLLYPHCL